MTLIKRMHNEFGNMSRGVGSSIGVQFLVPARDTDQVVRQQCGNTAASRNHSPCGEIRPPEDGAQLLHRNGGDHVMHGFFAVQAERTLPIDEEQVTF